MSLRNHSYCPECLKEGRIHKLVRTEGVLGVCDATEPHKLDPSKFWNWQDLQNLATVITITQTDPDKLQLLIGAVQKTIRRLETR